MDTNYRGYTIKTLDWTIYVGDTSSDTTAYYVLKGDYLYTPIEFVEGEGYVEKPCKNEKEAKEFIDSIESLEGMYKRSRMVYAKNGLNEKFEQHETLNPKIWDEKDGAYTLKKSIKNKLYKVIDTYIEDSDFLKEDDILDACVVGSNASFNYTNKSDIDLHLVVDMEKLSSDGAMAQFANNGEKSLFNNRYDIEMNGYNVEVYVEDVRTQPQSNGIYSLYKDEWIKVPKVIEADIDEEAYEKKYKKVEDKANKLLKDGSIKEIENFINQLYIDRRNSLARDGEAGDDNQIFKDLRNKDIISKLKDRMNDLKSKELSERYHRRRFRR